jgi:hypothetical protein
VQYLKISQKLLEPYSKTNVPQFIAGDMNTSDQDSSSFQQMLGIFNMKPCSYEQKSCYSYDCEKNDFILDPKIRPQLIDYIFYDKKRFNGLNGKMFVKIFRKKWHPEHTDLSDHFAILGTFMLD